MVSLSKSCSAKKAIGFGVNAVLNEKPDIRDESQENRSKKTDNWSPLETVVDSNTVGCDWNFDSDREVVESIVAKSKYDDDDE